MLLRPVLSRLLDVALPRSCLLCGAATGSTDPWCPDCGAELPRLAGTPCPICATPLAAPAPACGACLREPPAFDATLAALPYAYPVDRLVLGLKFGRRLAVADFLARTMLVGSRPMGTLMVAVPLPKNRLRERGFNQALEIARPLARALSLPLVATDIQRPREAPPQSTLPWRVRRRNVRQAFVATRDFSGQQVIVVDDVMTTGATLDALARTLKDHGAMRVINWVASRALKAST